MRRDRRQLPRLPRRAVPNGAGEPNQPGRANVWRRCPLLQRLLTWLLGWFGLNAAVQQISVPTVRLHLQRMYDSGNERFCAPFLPEPRAVGPIRDAALNLQSTFYGIWSKCSLFALPEEEVDQVEEITYTIAVFLAHAIHWKDQSTRVTWPESGKCLDRVSSNFSILPQPKDCGEHEHECLFSIDKVVQASIGLEIWNTRGVGDGDLPPLMPFDEFRRQLSSNTSEFPGLLDMVNVSCARLKEQMQLQERADVPSRLRQLQHSLIDFLEALEKETRQYHSFSGRNRTEHDHSTQCWGTNSSKSPSIHLNLSLLARARRRYCAEGYKEERDQLREAARELQTRIFSIHNRGCFFTPAWKLQGDEIEQTAYLVGKFFAHDKFWTERSLGFQLPEVENHLQKIRGTFGWASAEDQTFSVRTVMRRAIGNIMLGSGAANPNVDRPNVMTMHDFRVHIYQDKFGGLFKKFYGKMQSGCMKLNMSGVNSSSGMRLVLIQRSLVKLLCVLDREQCRHLKLLEHPELPPADEILD